MNCELCLKEAVCPEKTRCGHIFCEKCLEEYFRDPRLYHGHEHRINCPCCNEPVVEPPIKGYPLENIIGIYCYGLGTGQIVSANPDAVNDAKEPTLQDCMTREISDEQVDTTCITIEQAYLYYLNKYQNMGYPVERKVEYMIHRIDQMLYQQFWIVSDQVGLLEEFAEDDV